MMSQVVSVINPQPTGLVAETKSNRPKPVDTTTAQPAEAMDLTSALTNFQYARTLSQVQLRVARKILDIQEMQGDAAVRLIQAAAQGSAEAGDGLGAAATGLGSSLDTFA